VREGMAKETKRESKPTVNDAMLKWMNKYKHKFGKGFDTSLPPTGTERFIKGE
jgi:hypothetical protein